MSKLALVRHGQSEWNKKGLWTGWKDIPLTLGGKEEARAAATVLQGISFHVSYTSDLRRASETLEIIKAELKLVIPTFKHQALKERHYGEYTGKSKWEIQKLVGEEKFKKIRRGWDEPIKEGETLKEVYKRVVPFFRQSVLPQITVGRNVLLVSHGNTIRALIKHLENITDEAISEVEFATGEVLIYELDKKGKVLHTEKRLVKKKEQ